jgi:pimeloyl-ACP methyl ester carboxylesterase
MRSVKKIRFDPNSLAVASGGTGEPAVFVHGLGSNKSIWKHVCDGLRDVFRFYAIDLPGCGESPAPAHFRYTLEHFADVLTDFIVMKDLKKLTLVGTSFGGAIILMALLRNRDELASRVRSLCLIDVVAYPQDFPFFVEILRTPLFGALTVDFPFFVKILSRPLGPFPANALSRRYIRYFGRRKAREALIKTASLIKVSRLARYVPRLKTIDIPALVIWGRKDGVVPLRLGKRLARDLPNARLVVFDHCGHAPHEECTAEVIAAVKQFNAEDRGPVSSSDSVDDGRTNIELAASPRT